MGNRQFLQVLLVKAQPVPSEHCMLSMKSAVALCMVRMEEQLLQGRG